MFLQLVKSSENKFDLVCFVIKFIALFEYCVGYNPCPMIIKQT